MADHDVDATPAADNPRDAIPCTVACTLEGGLTVHVDALKLRPVQLQVAAGEAIVGVASLTLDGALYLQQRQASAGRLLT